MQLTGRVPVSESFYAPLASLMCELRSVGGPRGKAGPGYGLMEDEFQLSEPK